jgi:ribosome biogenesis GTPase A
MEEGAHVWKEGKSGNVLRLVLVVTKLDLLPTQVTPQRLENWVRRQSRFGGAEKLHGVHLVSSHKGWGIKNLAEHIKQLAGPRGNVWVIGAQNVGKLTLINAIGKHVGGKVSQLTEALIPGTKLGILTTLGILRVEGIVPDKVKLYDTLGLLHPYQMSTRLNREEQKMVQIQKELRPRSYRLTVGQCVHVGRLMRVDIEEASV